MNEERAILHSDLPYLFFLMHKELTDRLHFTEDLLTSLTVR